jgi:hypothetical protein
MRWTLKGTFAKELHGSQPSHEIENWKDVSHEKFETQGVEIFHFQDGKIKEAWTIFGTAVLNKLSGLAWLLIHTKPVKL